MVAAGTIEERMLQTLSFKQGLADFVLDAMGEAKDFEYQNRDEEKNRKKPSAFMQRLASIMGGDPVKVEPEPVAKAEAKIPPEERLRASVEAECPNVERMSVITTGARENKCISKAIVVGRGVAKEKIARQIADTQGVALPDEAIETIDPDTWQLMKRLEKMGVIQFNTEFLQDVVVRTAPDMERIEDEKRRAKAEKAYLNVIRQLSMGDLLMKGSFSSEAQDAYRKAVALAGGIASFACGAGSVDADITPVALEDLVCVRNRLMLSSEDALILQLAVQGLELPNASASARKFCQTCRELLPSRP